VTTTEDRLGPGFAKLWSAATTSALGNGLATIAAPLYVASRTGSPLAVAGASAVAWLPWLLFALPGGVLVDRLDRRRLMVAIDWIRVVVVGGLALAMATGHAGILLLYVALFVVNTGEIVFRSAAQALIPSLVPLARLERANGWLFAGTMVMQQIVAGPLGGFMFAAAAFVPFLVNSGTYAASAVLTGLVPGDYRIASGDGPRSWRREMVEGLRWLMHQRLLRTMALLIGLLNVTLTAAISVLVLLARDRLHLGSVGYGLLFTAMAVGSVLGAVTGDRIIKRVTATWTIRVGLLVEAGTHLVLAASRSGYVVGAALFAFGVHGSLWGIVGSSLRQRLAPPALLGRAGSTMLFIAAGGNSLGALLGGVLAGAFGLTAPYWVGFVVALTVTAMTWRVFDRATVSAAYADGAAAPTAD
jgi:MFS family permease